MYLISEWFQGYQEKIVGIGPGRQCAGSIQIGEWRSTGGAVRSAAERLRRQFAADLQRFAETKRRHRHSLHVLCQQQRNLLHSPGLVER